MVLLKWMLKNPYVQAVLQGLKPCIIGIILATGVFMIIQNTVGSSGSISIDSVAIILTALLACIYFGSRRLIKKGMSPTGLITISAVAGIVVYGLKGA